MNKTIDILNMVERFKNPDEFYQYALIIGPKVGYVIVSKDQHCNINIGDHFEDYPSIKIITLLWYYALMYNKINISSYYWHFPFVCEHPGVENTIELKETNEDGQIETHFITNADFQAYIAKTFSATATNDILNLSTKYVNEFIESWLDKGKLVS